MSQLSPAALDQLFLAARTHNAWDETPLDEGLLRQVYDLARWGPTEANSNPGRFVFVTSRAEREVLAGFATGKNPSKIRQAPCTVVIGYDLDYPRHIGRLYPSMKDAAPALAASPKLHDRALRGASMQGAYLILAARALGLDCGPMAGFDNQAVDDHFFAGANIKSNFLCSLGRGMPGSPYPRNDRFAFDEVARFV